MLSEFLNLNVINKDNNRNTKNSESFANKSKRKSREYILKFINFSRKKVNWFKLSLLKIINVKFTKLNVTNQLKKAGNLKKYVFQK